MNSYSQLISILEKRMNGYADSAISRIKPELGTITVSGLKLDSFKHPIKDYYSAAWEVCMQMPAYTTHAVMTTEGGQPIAVTLDVEAHEIEAVKLDFRSALKPEDRVLAVPIHGGAEAVVVCKVVKD